MRTITRQGTAALLCITLVVSPTMLLAQNRGGYQPCNYYMRGAVIGFAGQVITGMTGNPLGFFIATFTTVNNVYQYAHCMEWQRGGRS